MSNISSTYRRLNHNLVGLFAFDLVAQHGNFTGAAQALGVSQSAISQRIKALEIELGASLFKREHRGVTLTNDGMRLLNAVRPAMKQMANSVSLMVERKSKPRVRLSADFAFSTFWLLPRLPELRSELGEEIEIQILASQIPADPFSDDCDINIHVCAVDKMTTGDVLLLDEKVTAVCSPKFLEGRHKIKSAEELLELELLSLSKPPTAEWLTWQAWFDALNIDGKRSKSYNSFNNYDMVTQAAIAGHGVALGWLGLVDGLIQDGTLVTLTDDVVNSTSGYVMSKTDPESSKASNLVFDWINAKCELLKT